MPTKDEIDNPALWNERPSDYGPGKFEGETLITHYYYDCMLEGGGELLYSNDCYDDSKTGFLLHKDDPYDARIIAEAFGNPPLNNDPPFGVILAESGDGFVSIEVCNERQYRGIEKHLAKLMESTVLHCHCADKGCPVHADYGACANKATDILYRVDMTDETGTQFCAECRDDALSSGLFTTGSIEEDSSDEV